MKICEGLYLVQLVTEYNETPICTDIVETDLCLYDFQTRNTINENPTALENNRVFPI